MASHCVFLLKEKGTKFISKLVWKEILHFLIFLFFFFFFFENLTIKFYVPYFFNMHITFCSNQMVLSTRSINLFFTYNFRLQKLEILTFV